MPIDASIPLQVKSFEMPDQMNALARAMQIKGFQQQQEVNQLTMEDKRLERDQTNKLNAIYQSSLGADGKIDRQALYRGAATQGLGSKIPGLQKGFLETDEKAGKVDADKFTLATKRYDYMRQTMGALSQEPNLTKDMVVQAGQALVQQGILPPEMYQQAIGSMPDNPQELRARLQQGMKAQMTPEQIFTLFAPKPDKVDNGQQISYRDTNPNSPTYGQNTAGGVVQKVATPESVLTDQRTRSEGALNRQVTRDGQTLTDSRARDFNATKVEENNIKRDEKRATADLTKNSQIASFDTMLGTLDRLVSHPGLARSVGKMSALPTMPGSDSANFQAELNTFQSQAFLPMVAQLKGMGALSDSEGKKLTAAVGALDPKMGEEAFRASVKRIMEDMEAGRERIAGSRRTPAEPAAPAGGKLSPSEQSELDALRARFKK
jgi:hypothetical protein